MPPVQVVNTEVWGEKYQDFFKKKKVSDDLFFKPMYKQWLKRMKEYYELPKWKRIFTRVPKISPFIIERFGGIKNI